MAEPEKKSPGANEFSPRETAGRFVESIRLSTSSQDSSGCGLQLEEVPGGQIAVAGVEYGSPAFKGEQGF